MSLNKVWSSLVSYIHYVHGPVILRDLYTHQRVMESYIRNTVIIIHLIQTHLER